MRSARVRRSSRTTKSPSLLKKIWNNVLITYENSVHNIENYLDREINYLDFFRHYIIKKDLKEIPMNYKTFNFNEDDIVSFDDLNGDCVKEIIKISKNTHDKTWGVVLESSKIDDLNIYIAQMNKVQMLSLIHI